MNRIIDVGQARITSLLSPIDNGDPNFIAANIPNWMSMFGLAGTYSNIKSRQTGKVLITTANGQTVTISAVDLTKAIVRITYTGGNVSSLTNYITVSGELTNATTLNLLLSAVGNNMTVLWEVIEFNGVKSLQSGTWVNSNTSSTLNVSSINTSKSMLYYSSWTGAGATANSMFMNIELTSSTVLTCTKMDTVTYNIKWFLIEFY